MKKFTTILMACACVASMHAQHEFVISYGTTFSSMKGDDYSDSYIYGDDIISLIDYGLAQAEWTYDGSYSIGIGTSFAIEYAYYLTPYWKPYFRINAATQNVTYERSFTIEHYFASDLDGNAYDSFDFSILTRDIGFGVYREWNSGLSVGLGFNQITANQIDVEERYLDLLNGGNSEYTTASVDTPYGSFWKMEWAVKYQLGKFGIELRRRGLSDYALTSAIGDRTNAFRMNNNWFSDSAPTKIRSTSILLNYSIFINK
mgnify:CR=1 FL=1